MVNALAPVAKAVAAGVVTLAAYLAGVLTGNEGFTDVTTVEWLLGIVAVGSGYGITWAIPNREV